MQSSKLGDQSHIDVKIKINILNLFRVTFNGRITFSWEYYVCKRHPVSHKAGTGVPAGVFHLI